MDLLLALSKAMTVACRDLRARGVTHVQFSEPSLVVSPPDEEAWDAVRQAYEALCPSDGLDSSVHVFFAPAGAALPELLDLPATDFQATALDGRELQLSDRRRGIQARRGAALPELPDLPVDALGLDLYEEDLDALAGVDFDKALACGCVDARNSLLEAPEEIALQAARARDVLAPRDLFLCPNADLEFLPRPVAEAKVRALGQAVPLLEDTR